VKTDVIGESAKQDNPLTMVFIKQSSPLALLFILDAGGLYLPIEVKQLRRG
jgi:hypothetical protein